MNQQPMGQMSMGNPQPAVSKWLWIVLIIVILAGGGFFAWYYLMGPGKATTPTTTTPTTTTPTNKGEVTLANVTFYPTTTKDLYSDKEADLDTSIAGTCAVTDFSGKTIKATYQTKEGTAKITKGSSPGCPPTVVVETGTFTPSSTSTTTTTTTATATSPEKVAENFYNYYLGLVNPSGQANSQGKFQGTTQPYKLKTGFSDYLTTALITTLESSFNSSTVNADPILCAQDTPPTITYDAAKITNDTATSVVNMQFTPVHKVTLGYVKENGNWKINAITCP